VLQLVYLEFGERLAGGNPQRLYADLVDEHDEMR
jgi:hypothetical protein